MAGDEDLTPLLKSKFQISSSYEKVSLEFDDCPLTVEDLDDVDHELWLMKLPDSVDLTALKGTKLYLKKPNHLNGISKKGKTVTLIPSKTSALEEFRVVLPSSDKKSWVSANIPIVGELTALDQVLPPAMNPITRELRFPVTKDKLPDNLSQRLVLFGSVCPMPGKRKNKRVKAEVEDSPRKEKKKDSSKRKRSYSEEEEYAANGKQNSKRKRKLDKESKDHDSSLAQTSVNGEQSPPLEEEEHQTKHKTKHKKSKKSHKK